MKQARMTIEIEFEIWGMAMISRMARKMSSGDKILRFKPQFPHL